MDINVLMKEFNPVEGDFKNLDCFDFEGVYIIFDDTNDIVYIGSCYTRKISQRLKQYIKPNDTGNTLMHAICSKDFHVEKVKSITTDQKEAAVKKIKNFKIKAIRHEDLEYRLIKKAEPKYNTAGIDTEE